MSIPVLRKRDPWGTLGKAIAHGANEWATHQKNLGSEQRQEQSQIRQEERQQNYQQQQQQQKQQLEEKKKNALMESIKKAYADPRFKSEDPAERQSVLYEYIAPENPEVAHQIATSNINMMKAQQPKAPPGGVSAQPVPPEVGQKISSVLEMKKNAKADELAQAFDQAQIPRTYSNSYIENRRRQDETNAKNEVKQQNASREEKLAFHKESKEYDDELIKKTQVAKRQIDAINDIEKHLETGNVKPGSAANVFKGMGKIGDKISKALLNEDQAAINASIPQLLEGWKDIFGVRLSDADLKILEDKLPSISSSPESNKAVLKILRKYADMNLLRSRIANDITKENGDLRPLGYARKIEERFDEMIKPVKIINPNNGKTIDIPAYQLEQAMKKGAKLANE